MEEAAYLNEDETKGGARMNPNHQVTWLKTRPEFTIRYLRGTSTNRGYHESFYELICERELSPDDVKRLDDCNLLGMGQALRKVTHETFEDEVPPVVVDRRTGKRMECDCGVIHAGDMPIVGDDEMHLENCASIPRNHRGEVFTKTTKYEYHRYDFLRICDSGD